MRSARLLRGAMLVASGVALGSLGAGGCSLFANLDQYEKRAVNTTDAASDAACGDTTANATSCGACGHDCAGATCAASVCMPETVVSGDDVSDSGVGNGRGYPVFLAIDGGRMFWLDAFTAIKTRAVSGGAVASTPFPIEPAGQQAFAMSLNASSLFFTTVEGQPRYHSHVFRIARASVGNPGAVVDEIASTVDANHVVQSVRADDTAVFWGVHDGAGIMLGAIDTAAPNVAPGNGGIVAQDKVRPHALAMSASTLVWIDRAEDVSITKVAAVRAAPRAGGAPILFAAGNVPLDLLAVGPDAYFAWQDGQSTSIRRATLDGAHVDTLVPNVSLSGDVLYSDGATLVWSTIDNQASRITLWVCALASSCVSPLAVAALPVGVRAKLGAITIGPSVAIDGDWLYWTEPLNQQIQRVSIRGH